MRVAKSYCVLAVSCCELLCYAVCWLLVAVSVSLLVVRSFDTLSYCVLSASSFVMLCGGSE